LQIDQEEDRGWQRECQRHDRHATKDECFSKMIISLIFPSKMFTLLQTQPITTTNITQHIKSKLLRAT